MADLIHSDQQESEDPERYWHLLKELLPELPKEPKETTASLKPMTKQEARRFGNKLWPFGVWEGTRIDDVPLDYLEWYADLPLQNEVRRYLKCPEAQ